MTIKSTKRSGEDIWREYDAMEQRLSAPLSERMLDLAALRPGMNVLDIATGRGEPAIRASRRVHPHGIVSGFDVDHSMLGLARERADREGVTNLELAISNFQTLDGIPENHFNVALARWGLMYFQEPVQALKNVHAALVQGGPLVAAVWTDPEDAAFYQLPRVAASKVTSVPEINYDVAGTFYYSDLKKFASDLEVAGFLVSHSEVVSVDVMETSSDAELIAWGRTFGMSNLLDQLSLRDLDIWAQELIQLAEPYRTKEGRIRISGTSLIVVAE